MREQDATNHAGRVFGLDVLRAAAIIMVLAAHTWPSRQGLGVATGLGVLGVELFFVLSGFLIGRILIDLHGSGRLHSWGDVVAFWKRRWWRTLPNYFLFLTLHLSWRTWFMDFPDQISLNWTYFLFLQNFAQPSPNFFPETWSLAVEEWFYLLFPLALVLALRIAPKAWQAWAAVIGFFLLAPAIFRLCHALQPTHNVEVVLQFLRNEWDASPRKVVVLRFDAVIYGVFAAALAAWKPVIWRRLAALWPLAGVLILLVTVSLAFNAPLDRASPLQGWALLPLTSCGFVLLLPACSHWVEQPRLWTRSISWVAKISYSLYLCHGLVLLSLGKWFGPNSAFPLHRETWIWCIAVWIVSVAVASAVYRWFEKPMMDQRDRVKSKVVMNAPAVPTGLSADQAR